MLLGWAVAVAAALTWVLPAGEFDRRDEPNTGRRVVVAGTYHPVEPAPVGPFGAFVAIPRGFVAAAEVVAVVLFVGGAWIVVDRLGTLQAVVGALVRAFAGRGLLMVPIMSLFFASMGALENMQEEIIPLVPALLLLGSSLRIDAVTVVAMSAGAAMVGSAFGPTNPFQAGIALRLAELPPLSGAGLRLGMWAVGVALWIAWTMRYAARTRSAEVDAKIRLKADPTITDPTTTDPATTDPTTAIGERRHMLILALVLAPMAAYVYGALSLGWGFNELSAAFVIGGLAAGLVGGLSLERTVAVYIEGMQNLLPSALMVGVARSISIVLEDGRIVDTILNAVREPAFGRAAARGGRADDSSPGADSRRRAQRQRTGGVDDAAVRADGRRVGISRQVPVLAYQTGAGLMELATPTNGGLMAILLPAGVPFQRWIRFALGGLLLLTLVGIVSLLMSELVSAWFLVPGFYRCGIRL